MGNGRFSEKLTYKEWFEFNVAQRLHYNYLEGVNVTVFWLLIGGIYFSWIAFGFGVVYLFARTLYMCMYSKKGPNGRTVAVFMMFIANMGLFVLSIVSPAYLYKERRYI